MCCTYASEFLKKKQNNKTLDDRWRLHQKGNDNEKSTTTVGHAMSGRRLQYEFYDRRWSVIILLPPECNHNTVIIQCNNAQYTTDVPKRSHSYIHHLSRLHKKRITVVTRGRRDLHLNILLLLPVLYILMHRFMRSYFMVVFRCFFFLLLYIVIVQTNITHVPDCTGIIGLG